MKTGTAISLLLTLVLAPFFIMGQTLLFADDFESYSQGTSIASQSAGDWNTRSGATGNYEDPLISADLSFSGTNSLKIISENDILLMLGDKVTGRYQIEFMFYVDSASVGSFSLLQDFDISGDSWGIRVYCNADDQATIYTGGIANAVFAFNHEEWNSANMIVDIDDNFASLYINDQIVYSWIWNQGIIESDTSKLDAIEFFGWVDSTGNESAFYIDDVSFTEQPQPEPATDLHDPNIPVFQCNLMWTPPVSETPDNYLLIRNGQYLTDTITLNTYLDISYFPDYYEYSVRAHYNGLGYSPESNHAINNSLDDYYVLDRQLVLFETFTDISVPESYGIEMGLNDLTANGHEVAIVNYHIGDSYENDASLTRANYYNISGPGSTIVDGMLKSTSGSIDSSLYTPDFLPWFNVGFAVPAAFYVHQPVSVEHTGGRDYSINYSTSDNASYFVGVWHNINIMLVESHIPEVWSGLDEVNYVCREIYPDPDGDSVVYACMLGPCSYGYHEDISIDSMYDINNCSLIIFEQCYQTKQVLQAVMVDLADIPLKVPEKETFSISIYPNPAHQQVIVECVPDSEILIYDLLGKLIYKKLAKNRKNFIDISDFYTGIYTVSVKHRNQIFTKKLVVN